MKIRTRLNDLVREEGNKLVPYFLTGMLTKQKYGLGDVLTYNLGYRHLGATIGSSIPLLIWMTGTGYNIPNAIAGSIACLPFEAVTGFFGYIFGVCGDVMTKINHKDKK